MHLISRAQPMHPPRNLAIWVPFDNQIQLSRTRRIESRRAQGLIQRVGSVKFLQGLTGGTLLTVYGLWMFNSGCMTYTLRIGSATASSPGFAIGSLSFGNASLKREVSFVNGVTEMTFSGTNRSGESFESFFPPKTIPTPTNPHANRNPPPIARRAWLPDP